MIVSRSQGGGGAGAMTQIQNLSGAAASYDFTGILGTFNHLMLIVYGRGDTAAVSTPLLLRFNADAGANYDTELITASGAAVATGEIVTGTSAQIADLVAATAPASVAASHTIIIPQYAGAVLHKCAYSIGGQKTTSLTGGIFVREYSCFWRSAAAINRVTVTPTAGSFVAGSTATLYGLT